METFWAIQRHEVRDRTQAPSVGEGWITMLDWGFWGEGSVVEDVTERRCSVG